MSAYASDASKLSISIPKRAIPPGATCAHAHVFGPFERFPLAGGGYIPPLATAEMHATMLATLGLSRAVIVHPSAYRSDHAATLDAIARAPKARRGTGVVTQDVSDAELERLRAGGIRGMRFTEMRAKSTGQRIPGASGFEELKALGGRLKALGLHAQLYAPLEDFIAEAKALLAFDIPIVLDHMMRVGPSDRTVDDKDFQEALALLREGRIWVKLTMFRNSRQAPSYEDMRPFHDAIVEANPDRIVWGGDWPLLNMGDAPPDLGQLLDLLWDWLGDEELFRRVLCDNPARLYGFGPG